MCLAYNWSPHTLKNPVFEPFPNSPIPTFEFVGMQKKIDLYIHKCRKIIFISWLFVYIQQAAQIAYSRITAEEFKNRPDGHKIYVTSMCPGFCDTDLSQIVVNRTGQHLCWCHSWHNSPNGLIECVYLCVINMMSSRFWNYNYKLNVQVNLHLTTLRTLIESTHHELVAHLVRCTWVLKWNVVIRNFDSKKIAGMPIWVVNAILLLACSHTSHPILCDTLPLSMWFVIGRHPNCRKGCGNCHLACTPTGRRTCAIGGENVSR